MTDESSPAPRGSISWIDRLGLTPGRLCRGAVLVALGAAIAAVYLPGSVVPDTLTMCSEAIANVYTDWHSPAISGIWGFLDPPLAVIFVLTLSVTILAVHLILTRWLRPWIALAGTVAVMCFPATVGWMGHVGKDEWFAAAFLAGVALIARAGTERRPAIRRALLVGVVVCFWFAIAARKNALLPVGAALLLAWPVPPTIFGRFRARPLIRRVLASGLVLVVLVGSVSVFTSVVVRPRATHAEQSTYLFDLTGISLDEHRMLFPRGTFPRGTTLRDIDRAFDVKEGDGYFFGPDTPVDPFLTAPQVAKLQQAWLDAVLAHPDDYLRTRLSYTWALLGISAPHPFGSVNDPGSSPADFDLSCPVPDRYFPSLHQQVFDFLQKVEYRNLFRGWAFLLVLVVASLVAGLRRVTEARLLLVGGVLSLAGLALLGISPVYRYSWFTAVCALLAVALALSRIPALARTDGPPAAFDPSDGAATEADVEGSGPTTGDATVDEDGDVPGDADLIVVRRRRRT